MDVSRAVALELKRFRDSEAKKQGSEPYMVLQNATIDLLAEVLPKTNLELLTIKGIGPSKAKKYGPTILRIVQEAQTAKEETQSAPGDPIKQPKIYGVGEFIDTLNRALEVKTVSIRGDVTECDDKGYAYYVTLKDPNEQAILKCYIKKNAVPSGMKLERGMEIIVTGFASIHKLYNFALQVQEVLLTGDGVLQKAFEELKRALEKEGLFDIERKKPIPECVHSIGLITAAGSDAEKDVCTHVEGWGIKIYRYNVRVEGVRSVSEICAAIEWFNQYKSDVDVLIITRGGGSLESLQAYNSERVARTICASKIPVISAVGHTRDVSISDLVADMRADTPTHAGNFISLNWQKTCDTLDGYLKDFARESEMLLSKVRSDLIRFQDQCTHKLEKVLHVYSSRLRETYLHMHNGCSRTFEQFRRIETKFSNNKSLLVKTYQNYRRDIATHMRILKSLPSTYLERISHQVDYLNEKLSIANPELKLKQGYSIAFGEDGKVLRSVKQVIKGQRLRTKLLDGEVESVAD